MSWIYPRNRTKIVAFNGIFDPCQNATDMANDWESAGTFAGGTEPTWTQLSAPGGAGGYAHRLYAPGAPVGIANWIVGLSCIRDDNSTRRGVFPLYSPLQWKFRAEFRAYIVADEAEAGHNFASCGGFTLDGSWFPNLFARPSVQFNVANGKVGIKKYSYENDAFDEWAITSWAGAYDTWYDFRITWEYDFFNDPQTIIIKLWIDNTPMFTFDCPMEEWLNEPKTTTDLNPNQMLRDQFTGRCGPQIHIWSANGPVDVYFQDILVTHDLPNLIQFEYSDSILRPNALIEMEGLIATTMIKEIAKGTDIQLWLRNSTSDNWSGQWRGVVRDTDRYSKRLLSFAAEGYFADFQGEKAHNLVLTSKTTGQIVIEAINNPDKTYFNTTTYFDATSTTYNRTYINVAKTDILAEAAALEGFILYLDMGNKWHYQSPRSNYSNVHIKWGEDRIMNYELKDAFLRKPNKIRVNGSGVFAEKYIIDEAHTVSTELVREINRADLTAQADVDEVASYWASLYIRSIRSLMLELRANYNIEKGKIITVTIPQLGLSSARFLVTGIANNHQRRMALELLEVSPQLPLLLAEMGKRATETESEGHAIDTDSTAPKFHLAGIATANVHAEYEIEYSSAVVRSGDMTITDDFIDDLLDVLNSTVTNDPTHVGYGTGTDPAKYDDSALGSESARPVATVTKINPVSDYDQYYSGSPIYYYQLKFEIVVASPSGVTELGLFNAASSGTMTSRADFASYTQAGSVTFRIILSFIPEPGNAFITWEGIRQLVEWAYDGSWTNFVRMTHVLFDSPLLPTFWTTFTNAALAVPFGGTPEPTGVPKNSATWTLTKTLNAELDEILFSMDYDDYDFATDKEGDGDDFQSQLVALRQTTGDIVSGPPYTEFFALLHFRNTRVGSSYDNSECLWEMIIRFIRGQGAGYIQ